MDHKLSRHIIGPDGVQLLELEVGRVLELSREQLRHKSSQASELELSPQLIELLGLGSGDAIPGVELLESLLKWLRQVRSAAPVIHLTLSALPTQDLKLEFVAWFRQELHPQALLVFEYNRGLSGGFVVRLGSSLYDYSFRHALLTNSGAMVKVLKNV